MAGELGEKQISELIETLPGIASVLRSPVADAMVNLIRAGVGIGGFRYEDAEELIQYAVRRALLGSSEGDQVLEDVRGTGAKPKPPKPAPAKKAPPPPKPAEKSTPVDKASKPAAKPSHPPKPAAKPAAKPAVKPAARPAKKSAKKAPAKKSAPARKKAAKKTTAKKAKSPRKNTKRRR